jgi:hypothetical protein
MKTAEMFSRVRKAHPGFLVALPATLGLVLSIPAIASPSGSPSHTPAIGTNKIVLPQIPNAQLACDRSVYDYGQPVLLTFKIVNSTKKAIQYDFSSGQQAIFTITDSKGNDVWDTPAASGLFKGITHLTLAAGQSQTYQATWTQRDNGQRPVLPGSYTASAQLVPMPRVVVSGGIIVNTDPDPENTGMPVKGKGERGAVLQQDMTPPVASKVQITIRAAQPQPITHGASAH